MRIDDNLRVALLLTCDAIMASRPPDTIIGIDTDPYVHRWRLAPRGKNANAYIHIFYRDDHDSALHDHRYRNTSIILRGQCHEHFHTEPLTVKGDRFVTFAELRSEGDIVQREATTPHRISLIDKVPMTTIFFTGEEEREWGFHTVNGWMHWKIFTALNEKERPGGTYADTL